MDDQIRQVLADHARLNTDATTIGRDEDLFRAGLTSHASVNVMLALEDSFDIEFPDELLKRSTFETIASIADALASLETAEAH